jgi:hypothetical protein
MRDSVSSQHEYRRNAKGNNKVKKEAKQGCGDSTFKCAHAYCGTGKILIYAHKWLPSNQADNNHMPDDCIQDADNECASDDGTKD